LRNVTVSHDGDKWFIAIQTAREIKKPIHASAKAVAADLGTGRFATLSDRTILPAIGKLKELQAKKAKAQRFQARKKLFSKNWCKDKQRINQLDTQIANVRRDFLHQTSQELSKNHALIVLEDLQVKYMTASAKGTVQEPGKNVAQKSGLNRAILAQGWAEFRRQCEYKESWRGGRVVAVNPAYTSQECPQCHHIALENRQSLDWFYCVRCGFADDAHVVAALNILAAGHAVLACGDIGTPKRSKPRKNAVQQLKAAELESSSFRARRMSKRKFPLK
jgi:putative transposase